MKTVLKVGFSSPNLTKKKGSVFIKIKKYFNCTISVTFLTLITILVLILNRIFSDWKDAQDQVKKGCLLGDQNLTPHTQCLVRGDPVQNMLIPTVSNDVIIDLTF